MPVLPSAPSDFTATIKSAAIANAAVGGVSFRPSKNSGGYVSLGALGAIVTQSAVAQATISQRFDPDIAAAPAPAAPIIQSITLTRTGTTEVFIVKYNTDGSIQWARRINGQGTGWTSNYSGLKQAITTDTTGNVYVAGISGGALTVFDADNSTTAFSLNHSGGGDAFIVKYDSLGTPLWARRIAGTLTDQGNGIGTDSSGNVYVMTVSRLGPISIFAANDIDAAITLPYAGNFDTLVVKYSSSGTPLWARKFGGVGGGGDTFGLDFAVDADGNTFTCGYMTGNVNLYDGDNNIFSTLTKTTSEEGFLIKYDANGVPKWGRRLVRAIVASYAVSVDSSGNAYVASFYNSGGTFTAFGGSTSVTLPASAESNNAALVKYDTNGEPQWARAMNGTNTSVLFGIATDSAANIYIIGRYAGTLVIRNADNTTFLSSAGPGGDWDIGLVKYSSDGTPQWLRRIGGSGFDQGLGVDCDSTGNIYITGSANNSVIVYNGDGIRPATTTFTTLTNSGAEDGLLVKYNTTGTPLWGTRISGTGSDIANRITVDASGNPHVIGSYTSNPLTLRTTGF